jgi:cytochrome c oxidase cbb3-type subunit IV
MDVNTLRIAVTLLSLMAFVGIVVWACAKRNRERFDEAAQLPFADDARETRDPR